MIAPDAPLKYRPDIDGLRAIAVVLVVGFHAFPGRVPDGCIGVDVFIVISGYLITGLILRDLQQGSFSIGPVTLAFLFRKTAGLWLPLGAIAAASSGLPPSLVGALLGLPAARRVRSRQPRVRRRRLLGDCSPSRSRPSGSS